MIKYSLYNGNYYFLVPQINEDWCCLFIKTEIKNIFITLWKDALNDGKKYREFLYKTDSRDIETIKSYFDLTKENKKLAIVSFTKDEKDYIGTSTEIQEDDLVVSSFVDSEENKRELIFGSNLPEETYEFPKGFNKKMLSNGIPFGQLSKLLGFDTEAFIKPKNMQDFRSILDEGIRIMKDLNTTLDKEFGTHSREDFCVGDKRFTQYMDKEDNAHILIFDPSIKKQMIDKQRIDLNPWVEVFIVDPNFCYFKNKYENIVGKINLKSCDPMKWEFIVYDGNQNNKEKRLAFECKKSTPYDCEREIIKWMIENNLFDKLVNFE